MTSFACQPFATVDDFLAWGECGCDLTEEDNGDLIESALSTASDLLMLASDGRITGVCTSTVHPLGPSYCLPVTLNPFLAPQLASPLEDTIPLRGPNTTIVSVKINGVTLASSEYQLVNGRFLKRVTGSWPSGSLSNDVFEVVYSFGRLPDLIAKNATLEMACELMSFYLTGKTRLDPGVTSANIQGASISLRNSQDEVQQYLPRVGAFLAAYAPKGLNQNSGVWSPELEHGWELIRVSGT